MEWVIKYGEYCGYRCKGGVPERRCYGPESVYHHMAFLRVIDVTITMVASQ